MDNQEFNGSMKRTRSVYRTTCDITSDHNNDAVKRAYTNKYQNFSFPSADGVDEDCNHKLQHLKFTVDKTNFDSAFLEQVKKMKRKYPTHCSKCNVEFRNK